MEFDQKTDGLSPLFPNLAAQLRSSLGNIHLASVALAPPDAREQDPTLDAKAAILDQSYYQLLRLVNNLTMASLLKSSFSIPARDRDIVALMRDTCEKSSSLAELLGLRFSFSCTEAFHICAVYGDTIEQIVFQLLSNAFKFTEKGGSVTVELKFVGQQVVLSVADTGCGIPEELLPSLFDRYLHKDLMNPPPYGLGLGLPICLQIAEGYGGNIMAESKAGKGSRITLSIPDRQTGIFGVSDVPYDYSGGFNQTLMALSDALPAEAFRMKNQD